MLELEERGAVMIVRLAHGKVNALDTDLLNALTATVGSLPIGQPLVLTGAGRSFCAGVDLKRIAHGGLEYVKTFRPALSQAVKALFDHPGPVVAAVNGHAIAGGCVLAAACDIRLMSSGTIGLSEMRVGVPFPGVALEVVRHAVGAAARRLILEAALLSPADAVTAGLIDRVTTPDSLLDDAIAEAERLASIPADVYAYTKRQLQDPARARINAISQADEDAATAMWAAPAIQSAVNAFLDGIGHREDPCHGQTRQGLA